MVTYTNEVVGSARPCKMVSPMGGKVTSCSVDIHETLKELNMSPLYCTNHPSQQKPLKTPYQQEHRH